MRVKVLQAFGLLVQELFIVTTWLGLWGLAEMTNLTTKLWFNLFCLFLGASGLFAVKAFEPTVFLRIAEETTNTVVDVLPGRYAVDISKERIENIPKQSSKIRR